MLGEPLLRVWTRRPFDKVTVPLLLAEERRLADSLAIARWADERGRGATLFPREHQPAIAGFNALSERLLEAARARVTPRIRDSPAACMEAVPRPLRRLGKIAERMAAQGASFIMQKYATGAQSEALETMREGLRSLREALGDKPYVLGELTYADIAMAVTLQAVVPVSDAHLFLGPATRRAWSEPALAEEFADLVAWRDTIYTRHR